MGKLTQYRLWQQHNRDKQSYTYTVATQSFEIWNGFVWCKAQTFWLISKVNKIMAEGSINNMMQKVLQCTFALSLAFDPSLAAQAVISSFQSMQV